MIEFFGQQENKERKPRKKKKNYKKEFVGGIGYAQSSNNKRDIVRNNPFR